MMRGTVAKRLRKKTLKLCKGKVERLYQATTKTVYLNKDKTSQRTTYRNADGYWRSVYRKLKWVNL